MSPSETIDVCCFILFAICTLISIIAGIAMIHYKRKYKRTEFVSDRRMIQDIIDNIQIILIQFIGVAVGLLIANIII